MPEPWELNDEEAIAEGKRMAPRRDEADLADAYLYAETYALLNATEDELRSVLPLDELEQVLEYRGIAVEENIAQAPFAALESMTGVSFPHPWEQGLPRSDILADQVFLLEASEAELRATLPDVDLKQILAYRSNSEADLRHVAELRGGWRLGGPPGFMATFDSLFPRAAAAIQRLVDPIDAITESIDTAVLVRSASDEPVHLTVDSEAWALLTSTPLPAWTTLGTQVLLLDEPVHPTTQLPLLLTSSTGSYQTEIVVIDAGTGETMSRRPGPVVDYQQSHILLEKLSLPGDYIVAIVEASATVDRPSEVAWFIVVSAR